MRLMMLWPWPVTLAVTVLLGALCVAGWRRSKDTATLLRRGLMVAAVAALGLTPASQISAEERVSNADLFFVVDLTGSMAAEDYNGTEQRLDGVKADMRDIIDANPGARYSVIAFSSTATEQLPLTTDSRAALAWLETARRESTNFSEGSSLARPAPVLEDALTRAAENNPQNVRIVLVFSDGEDTADSDAEDSADYGAMAGLVDDGFVFGYGTEAGGRMLSSSWGTEDRGRYIQDPETGTDAISRIDEDNLHALADQLGLDYVHRDAPGGAGELVAEIPVDLLAADGREDSGRLNPILWPIGLVLLGLVGWELWHLTPQIAALRRAR